MRTAGMFREEEGKKSRPRRKKGSGRKKKPLGIRAATVTGRKQATWEAARRECRPAAVTALLEVRLYRADLKRYVKLPGWKVQMLVGELRELEGLRVELEKLLGEGE